MCALKQENVGLEKGSLLESLDGNLYSIVNFLGRGKNNIVWRVLCVSGKRRGQFFALKLQYNLKKTRVKRFFREVEFLKQQSCTLITQYRDSGYYEARDSKVYPFAVIDCFPETLREYFRNTGLTFEKKMRFSCQLLAGLNWLRDLNVLHRDIKPENIFTNGEAVVLGDFGLVKDLSKMHVLAKSFNDLDFFDETSSMPRFYRTPELVDYAKNMELLRIESDTFQMGLVLAELFTGMNPLKQSEDKLSAIELIELPEISDSNYGKQIRELILGMLEMDYQKRLKPGYLLDQFISIYQDLV